jgi:hypothetical protein
MLGVLLISRCRFDGAIPGVDFPALTAVGVLVSLHVNSTRCAAEQVAASLQVTRRGEFPANAGLNGSWHMLMVQMLVRDGLLPNY